MQIKIKTRILIFSQRFKFPFQVTMHNKKLYLILVFQLPLHKFTPWNFNHVFFISCSGFLGKGQLKQILFLYRSAVIVRNNRFLIWRNLLSIRVIMTYVSSMKNHVDKRINIFHSTNFHFFISVYLHLRKFIFLYQNVS